MDRKTMIYTDAYGDDNVVAPVLNMYRDNNNLYVGLEEYDPELEDWDSFCSVTVNTAFDLPFLESAINMEYGGQAKIDFLLKNGFGSLTGTKVRSGREEFPVFRFSAEKLKELNPTFFAEYCKIHGHSLDDCSALVDQIQFATIKKNCQNNCSSDIQKNVVSKDNSEER